MKQEIIKFSRDPREFDSSEYFLGISILLYSFDHWIGGTISLILAMIIWFMYKVFSKYNKQIKQQEEKNDNN